MNTYITGKTIKELRENKNLTQRELASLIGISDKAVSKWETGRGFPDISLIEPLAQALAISVPELLAGNYIINSNVSGNMLRSKFYVCPICGNIIHTMGEGVITCCGITLPILEVEEADGDHQINIEYVENEYYVTINHSMTKTHYISFIAYVTSNKIEMTKLYAEGNAESRFLIRGHGALFYYCNKHGLMRKRI